MADGSRNFRDFFVHAALLGALLVVAACATGQPKTPVEEKAAQIVARHCVLKYAGDGGIIRQDDKIDTSQVTIASLRKNNQGWIRITTATGGFVDNIFYRSGRVVCGGRTWTNRFPPFQPVSGEVTLNDLGGGAARTNPSASPALAALSSSAPKPSVTGRNMKVVWNEPVKKTSKDVGTVTVTEVIRTSTTTGGLIDIHATETGGGLLLTMPGGKGQCRGSYFYGRQTGKGTWGATCSGDVSAWGDFHPAGLTGGTAGQGKDSTGRTVSFTLDTASN